MSLTTHSLARRAHPTTPSRQGQRPRLSQLGVRPRGVGPDPGPAAAGRKNVTITELAYLLRTDGTDGAFAFFPVSPHIQDRLLDLAYRLMEENADVFVAFIMPPGSDDAEPTVDAATPEDMVSTYPGLSMGYGELGLYEIEGRRDTDFPPDAVIFQEIYPGSGNTV